MKLINGFFMAWGNFCVIPCPYRRWDENARKWMLVMFPLIGGLIGILWYGLYRVMEICTVPVPVCAGLLTAYPFAVSGFIHLDGFMDCNDAILSRRPLQERQRILKDSHVGAFAVITVVLLFLLFFSGMWTIAERGEKWDIWCLIFLPVLARAASAKAVLTCPPLSSSQYRNTFDKRENRIYRRALLFIWILAAGSMTGGMFLLYGKQWSSILAAGCGLAASWLSSRYARKQLGGMSGDIAGYMLVWTELTTVLFLAVE